MQANARLGSLTDGPSRFSRYQLGSGGTDARRLARGVFDAVDAFGSVFCASQLVVA
jgi:hypothetical protein